MSKLTFPKKELIELNLFSKIYAQGMEQIITAVLKQYLGREPILEDALRGELVSGHCVFDRYGFKMDGKWLGMIFIKFVVEKATFHFEPGCDDFLCPNPIEKETNNGQN
jgi:hypothetical protein